MKTPPDLWQNISQDEAKAYALEFQKTGDQKLLHRLLIKFDRLIIKTIQRVRKRCTWLKEENIEEVYTAAVAGFMRAVHKVRPDIESKYIHLLVSSYVKRELYASYVYKRREMREKSPANKESMTADLSTHNVSYTDLTDLETEDFYALLKLAKLTPLEQELLIDTFIKEIPTRYYAKGKQRAEQTIHRRLKIAYQKIKELFISKQELR